MLHADMNTQTRLYQLKQILYIWLFSYPPTCIIYVVTMYDTDNGCKMTGMVK